MIKVYQWHVDVDNEEDLSQEDMNIISDLMFGRKEVMQRIWNEETPLVSYRLVASVETDELDVAFRLTNSINTAWYKDAKGVEVAPEVSSGCRSTSTGDILQLASGEFIGLTMHNTEVMDLNPEPASKQRPFRP